MVATKYNYLIGHMEIEERDLFETKLNRIDEVGELNHSNEILNELVVFS